METKIFELPEFPEGSVSCVYVGKPNKCMCGCSGKYTYTKVNQAYSSKEQGYPVKDEEVSDAKVQRVINKVRKNQPLPIEVIDDYIYTAVIGQTQYTIYLRR